MKKILFTLLIISSLHSQGIVTDTLSYSNVANDSFDLFVDEIALVVHKMPVDGTINSFNIPIASWGDSSGALIVEMYLLNYPLDSSGNKYDNTFVDENGWLGYYSLPTNDSLLIPYVPYWGSNPVWNSFGDSGYCTGISPISNSYPPLKLLIWRGDFAPMTIDPYNNNLGDNWINRLDGISNFTELDSGDYIGISIKYINYSNNNINKPVTLFSDNNTGLNDPWRFLLFSLQCSGTSGEGGWHIRSETINCELEIEYTELTNVEDLNMPVLIKLRQNHPNPFNPTTTIQYELQHRSNIQITIYDLLGRRVTTLVSESQDAGFKSVQWNATNDHGKPVSAGVYLYQIRARLRSASYDGQAREFVQTRKMVLLK